MSSQTVPLITPEKYLAQEREAEYKSEYYQGHVYRMPGAKENHVLIGLNISDALRRALRGRGCRVYATDMRLRVSATGLYTYPDVMAVCNEPEFADANRDVLLNPHLIVEVHSKSTEAYDRGDKFRQYQTLLSLQEYVLVAQTAPRIEQFIRHPDREWVYVATDEPGKRVYLASLIIQLALDDVYSEIQFVAE